ncbi:MAG: flavin monoamine oxidase family protein [Acidimicrobiia bacterium]
MRRRDLLKMVALLGVAGAVGGCGDDEGVPVDRPEGGTGSGRRDLTVLVVGAGAAGMSAAHLLARRGVDVEVIEARPFHGGRIERLTGWVDFPIPLGGEWLHGEPDELRRIVDDPQVEVATEVVPYRPDDPAGYFEDGALFLEETGEEFEDRTFVGSSWLDFFDTYIVPGIADRMTFDTVVTRIEHGDDGVAVTNADGVVREADAVIVTVPLTVLRDGDIEFDPALPGDKLSALGSADVWGGIKVFLEFDEHFYPVFLAFPDSETRSGQRYYYDAAYAQSSDAHVMGLFAVGAQARPYQALEQTALRDHILAELDEIFDGAASRSYLRHVSRNWDEEPFIRQAYLADHADWRQVEQMGRPFGDRLWFAGDAYTDGENWSEVHTAARSARVAVDGILNRH